MSRRQMLTIAVVAAVALATGFLVAGQIKAQVLIPSNQVARYQALVRSVQDLEAARRGEPRERIEGRHRERGRAEEDDPRRQREVAFSISSRV